MFSYQAKLFLSSNFSNFQFVHCQDKYSSNSFNMHKKCYQTVIKVCHILTQTDMYSYCNGYLDNMLYMYLQ